MEKSKSVETINHGVISYRLYGDKGECNEYYIIITRKSANIEELL